MRQPVLFVGHGNPMNAIQDTPFARAWQRLGKELPTPRAILAVSAHWYIHGTHLTDNDPQRTIHDFGGFPGELFQVQYPAPGDPALAARARDLLRTHDAHLDPEWGLDHGTWSVLRHLRPNADLPVVQLSIDATRPGADHIAIGQALSPLREDDVLILASGNITHNLPHAFGNMHDSDSQTPDWARDFDRATTKALQTRATKHLAHAHETSAGRQAHPTPDHYLPLLYAYGASHEDDALSFPVEGYDMASISMRACLWHPS